MELYFFRHEEYLRAYNCSGINFNSSTMLQKSHQFMPESIVSILLCAIYYILYIPCMFSMWKHLRSNHYYLLLFYIGIMDLGILWILGFLHAWLSLTGSMFCNYPKLIYFTGDLASSIWRGESAGDLLLAINRCLDIAFPTFAKFLFAGHRIGLWLGLCLLYFFCWVIFQKPAIFNPLFFEWFFDPFYGYREDDAKANYFIVPMHNFHNYFMAFAFPFVYIIFMVAMYFKFRVFKVNTIGTEERAHQHQHVENSWGITEAEKKTFIQVLLISMLNTIPAITHVFLQQFKDFQSQFWIYLGYYLWLHLHGFPPVIYLTFNKTIRHDCKMFFMKRFRPNQVTHIHGITVIRRREHQQTNTT